MVSTGELTAVENKMNSMDEQTLWYLSGAVDSISRIGLDIHGHSSMKIGYQIIPTVTFSRPKEADVLLGMVDECSEEWMFDYRIQEQKNSTRMFISNKYNIESFLEPIMGGFIQQRERAEFFVEEILPLFDDGPPNDKESVLEIMERVETLREYPIQKGSSKYDYEYFEENL